MHWRRYLDHPALAGFAALEAGAARMLVRRGLEPFASRLGLDGDPPSPDTIAGGRARHPVVALPDGSRAVVRRYHRGGAVRHVNRATYFVGHRAFHELLATERARAGGVRAPQVLAATERRTGLGYAAWLATRLLTDTAEGAAWMASASPDERNSMLREAGRQIALMHAAGIAHPDLNLHNLLVSRTSADPARQRIDASAAESATQPVVDTDAAASVRSADSPDRATDLASAQSRVIPSAGRDLLAPARGPSHANDTSDAPSPSSASTKPRPIVYLIDFDSARLYDSPVPPSRRAADIRRLARSARKLAAPIGAGGWMAMREGYGAAWPLSADETRALG
jgi:3-deoxy-D-manno-octulosonic acid kinase